MKNLYKSTKAIYDAHKKEYQVYYKNWFVWKYDSCYKFDEKKAHYDPIPSCITANLSHLIGKVWTYL